LMLREIWKIVNGIPMFHYAWYELRLSYSQANCSEKYTICRGTHKYGSISE